MCDLFREEADCVELALITARAAVERREKGGGGFILSRELPYVAVGPCDTITTLSGPMLEDDGKTIKCENGAVIWHRMPGAIPNGGGLKDAIYFEPRSDGLVVLGRKPGNWEPTRVAGFAEEQPGMRRV